jgi:hypothetical protein
VVDDGDPASETRLWVSCHHFMESRRLDWRGSSFGIVKVHVSKQKALLLEQGFEERDHTLHPRSSLHCT